MKRLRVILIAIIAASTLWGCKKKHDPIPRFTKVVEVFDQNGLLPDLPVQNGRTRYQTDSFKGIAVRKGRFTLSDHDARAISMQAILEGLDASTKETMLKLGVMVVNVDGDEATDGSAKRVITYRKEELAGRLEITLKLNETKTELTCEIYIEELADWADPSDVKEMLKEISIENQVDEAYIQPIDREAHVAHKTKTSASTAWE